jgi:hypothetical protein
MHGAESGPCMAWQRCCGALLLVLPSALLSMRHVVCVYDAV